MAKRPFRAIFLYRQPNISIRRWGQGEEKLKLWPRGKAAVIFSDHMDALTANVDQNDVDRQHSLGVVWLRVDEHSHFATIRAGDHYEKMGFEKRIVLDPVFNEDNVVAKVLVKRKVCISNNIIAL